MQQLQVRTGVGRICCAEYARAVAVARSKHWATLAVVLQTSRALAEEPSPPVSPTPATPDATAPPGATTRPATGESHPTPARNEASSRGSIIAPEVPRAPGADAAPSTGTDAEEEPSLPPRLPWRGTSFTWGHNVTTSALGIGDPLSNAHEQYVQTFTWVLNYFVVDYERLRVRITTAPGFEVEMTNSNTTGTLREPQIYDLPVSVVASTPLYQRPGSAWSTGLIVNYATQFPLSEASQGSGRILVTSPRALIFQSVPVFGKGAAVLADMAIGLSARWDHIFSRAEYPVNSNVQRPGQTFQGNPLTDDKLSATPLAHDGLRFGGFVFLDEEIFGDPLQLTAAFVLAYDYAYDVDPTDCHAISTGECVVPRGDVYATNVRYRTGFSLGLTYFPEPELGISLGYSNAAEQLGPSGTLQNPLYSPDALFQASLSFSIDALYERLTGPKRSDPFLLFGKSSPRRHPGATATF